MKPRYAFFLLIILTLPVLLAACGGGAKGNAEDFIKAAADNDVKKMKDVSCSGFHSAIDLLTQGAEKNKVEDIKCEEKGDNIECTWKSDGESTTATFIMDDKKVCDIEIGGVRLKDTLSQPTPSPATDNTDSNDNTSN
jgi:hypothetical protein